MLVFPQLQSGAVAQWPFSTRTRFAVPWVAAGNGTRWRLFQPGAGERQWRLRFTGLSEEEAAGLRSFYAACGGPLRPFLFVDPTANLLRESEDLTASIWNRSAGLTLTAVAGEPGRYKVWRFSAADTDGQTTQHVGIAEGFRVCISLAARSEAGTGIELLAGAAAAPHATASEWRTFSLNASCGEGGLAAGVRIPAGGVVEVKALQICAQPTAGAYVPSGVNAGIYPNAHFATEELALECLAPGLYEAEVVIVSRMTR